jgi:hypothetical protein
MTARCNKRDRISCSDDKEGFSKALSPKRSGGQTLVRSLNPIDVLMGRGNGPNDHIGNGSFRKCIEERLGDYVGTISRKAKDKIALRVVRTVQAKKGRFVKKLKKCEKLSRGIAPEETVYITVDDAAAVTKSKQAFRYVHKAARRLDLHLTSSTKAMHDQSGALRDETKGCPTPLQEVQGETQRMDRKQGPKCNVFGATTRSEQSGYTIEDTAVMANGMANIDMLSSVATTLERLNAESFFARKRLLQMYMDQLQLMAASHHASTVRVLRASVLANPDFIADPLLGYEMKGYRESHDSNGLHRAWR